jgi:hypothetical protein
MRGVRGIRCAEGVTGLPSLRCQDAMPEAGRIVGPCGVLRVVGDLGPAVVALIALLCPYSRHMCIEY